MRFLSVAMLVTVAAFFGSAGIAAAAPKDYCADLKGGNTGSVCEIQLSDPGYRVDISIPLNYPDQKSLPRPEVDRRLRLSDARQIPQRGQVGRAARYPV